MPGKTFNDPAPAHFAQLLGAGSHIITIFRALQAVAAPAPSHKLHGPSTGLVSSLSGVGTRRFLFDAAARPWPISGRPTTQESSSCWRFRCSWRRSSSCRFCSCCCRFFSAALCLSPACFSFFSRLLLDCCV